MKSKMKEAVHVAHGGRWEIYTKLFMGNPTEKWSLERLKTYMGG